MSPTEVADTPKVLHNPESYFCKISRQRIHTTGCFKKAGLGAVVTIGNNIRRNGITLFLKTLT